MYLAVPADHRVKIKENEMRDKFLDLVRKLKTQWNMKVTVVPIVVGRQGASRDHPDKSIIKICQNTEKSPGDMRRLGVSQTSVRNHQQPLL